MDFFQQFLDDNTDNTVLANLKAQWAYTFINECKAEATAFDEYMECHTGNKVSWAQARDIVYGNPEVCKWNHKLDALESVLKDSGVIVNHVSKINYTKAMMAAAVERNKYWETYCDFDK